MGWVILGVTVVAWVLAMAGRIPLWAAIVATLVIAFIGALRLDRTRSLGAPAPFRDENRPDFYAPMENENWQVPTAYIDHPTGGGSAPGSPASTERVSERWPPGARPDDDHPFGRK